MTRGKVKRLMASAFFLLSAGLVVFGGIWMAVVNHDFSILRVLAVLAALYGVLIAIGLLSGSYQKAMKALPGDHKFISSFVTEIDVGNFRFFYHEYEKGGALSPFNKSYVSMMVGIPFPQDDEETKEALMLELQELINDLSGRGVLTGCNPIIGVGEGDGAGEGGVASGDEGERGVSNGGGDAGAGDGAGESGVAAIEAAEAQEALEAQEAQAAKTKVAQSVVAQEEEKKPEEENKLEKEERKSENDEQELEEDVTWVGQMMWLEFGRKAATAALLGEVQGRLKGIIDKYGLQEMEYSTICGEENGTGYRYYKGNMFNNAVFITGSNRIKYAYKTAANMYLAENESYFDLARYQELYESIPAQEGNYSIKTLEGDVEEMFRCKSSKDVKTRFEYEKDGFAVNITLPRRMSASTYHIVPSTGYWWVYAHGRLDNIDPISTEDESFACEMLLRIISKYSQDN